jgi:hypothetical protein
VVAIETLPCIATTAATPVAASRGPSADRAPSSVLHVSALPAADWHELSMAIVGRRSSSDSRSASFRPSTGSAVRSGRSR